MKILGIDSSGLVASVAVVEDNELIGEYTLNYKKTHSQTLLPMLDELKQMIELDLDSIDAIAVAAGPGSFTGLRIGSATAKGLGLALEKPLIAVPTVDGLAFNLWGAKTNICPIMDARRNQTYTGLYAFDEKQRFQVLVEQCAVDI
nr:tRNA (adenosine(37)-N6)-threonylcarbamoyltransferase complex dimerization subunit type 1 TsaB [Lachnospiraceae bacterium]